MHRSFAISVSFSMDLVFFTDWQDAVSGMIRAPLGRFQRKSSGHRSDERRNDGAHETRQAMSRPSQEAPPPSGGVPRTRTPSMAVASALVVASLFGLQGGGAVATLLFDRVTVPAVVTLRLSFAALILMVACRPSIALWRAHWKLFL